ncbi:MAG: carboxypeptidase regulatory-like domain-containing protein [Bacteroidetes bacterium]|nr:carboxypeptidase regulatory-like domain-containing protein [Bacteroidota bacterium]MBS1974626.1 carboxypeptidase regulatory-like domain-containing protein [Bacteroidota bacterium]
MKNSKTWLLLFALFITVNIGKANTGKPAVCLHGFVTDAVTKKPVKGVVVSAIIPGITEVKEVTTDSAGYFNFGELQVQQVTLQFGKKGYISYRRNNVSMKENASVKVNVEFVPDNKEDGLDESEYPILRMLEFN